LNLQTTTNKEAKDITMQEVNDIVKELLAVLSDKKAELGMKRTDKFWICLDKATVHNEVVQVVGTKAKLWPQPPHSPDCNKPIEHVHAQVDAGVHAWLLDTRQHHPSHTITVEESKAKVEEVFYSMPTSSIKADVESLPSTWEAIIANHGGFVASKLS
jgi:hypothetical protein